MYDIVLSGDGYVSTASIIENNIPIARCLVYASDDKHSVWKISIWKVREDMQRRGYGKKLLKAALEQLRSRVGIPTEVIYLWNGSNQYVMDWMMRHFEPVCMGDIAAIKYQADDDWESHMYKLNVKLLFKYLENIS